MAVTCTHFRFGSDDGTEVTHTFKALIDTNPTHNWAWVTFLLRLTEQCDATAASNEAATFQYQKNGGTWTNITTTSANVKSVTPSAWANNAHNTKRLTGTGTFETTGAGCTTDGTSGGTANDIVASGNSETEIALQFVEANLANGDTMAFRITGSPAAITMSISPSITIVKTVNYSLTANGITTTPSISSPAISQNHVITANGETTTPQLANPAISQNHVISALALTIGVPVIGAPALTIQENYPLTANNILMGVPQLGGPTLAQIHALVAEALTTGVPILDNPVLGGTEKKQEAIVIMSGKTKGK